MSTDSEIQEDVIEALNGGAAFDSSGLKVAVKDRFATLEGQVHNNFEKLEARRTAQCVAGVRAVIVRIEVLSMEAMSYDQTTLIAACE